MHHTYRNIEPLNIEWCALLSTIFNLFQGKKKLGSIPTSKHIFLIIPEFPGKKKKNEKVYGQTSFISDMKLYTISLQNPNKKTHL